MGQEERIVGTTIAGKYRVRRVVGAGAMGLVCEAVHLEIGKRLAIKTIDASLAGMGDIALRFRQEARAASLIESQHIVQVFDVGHDEELGLYLVMEYLSGEDLANRLARDGRLPPDVAMRIAAQAARGLAKAHEAGVVHRDLKPANIFLVEREDEEPLVKILDFGISKVVEASRGSCSAGLSLTRAGTVIGTPQYMSPEQAQGYAVDERTDVWALGLVLYEMLAGRPAYPELASYEQFIIRLVSRPPDPLLDVAPWVPESLAVVVHEALAHDVHERIPTCNELLRRLLRVQSVSGGSAPVGKATPVETWAHLPATCDGDGGKGDGPGSWRPPSLPPVPAESGCLQSAPQSEDPTAVWGSPQVAALNAEPVGEGDDDAPQFFDRKALFSEGSALSRAVAEAHGTERSLPPLTAAAALRARLVWAALACLALGVAVVVVVALH
ncbi:MAG: serine/threonine protein kinase [Myxococcota bacterium]|nr:serine/threonine protein kinase [Myxococcota bacterium]